MLNGLEEIHSLRIDSSSLLMLYSDHYIWSLLSNNRNKVSQKTVEENDANGKKKS